MENITQSPVMLYTEQTPNPETLKYVTNRMFYKGIADFKDRALAETWSPLAAALFNLPYIKGVYICNNFVTITKEFNYEWADVMLPIKDFIKKHLEEGSTVIRSGFAEAMLEIEATTQSNSTNYSADDSLIVEKIKNLIETYVKPAVEMDGGNIAFKSYHQGKVGLIMQGACSGCPSSSVTLKSGIEGMLKRMIPEVTEVVAEMG